MFTGLLEKLIFLDEGVRQAYQAYVESGKLDNDTFDKIKGVDPTPSKKYVDWMCKQVVKDSSLDIDQLGVMVKEFDDAIEKGKIKKKDVQSYSFEELDRELDRIEGAQTKGEIRKAQKEDAEIVLEDERFFIVSPKTKEAAILYGKHTEWCTSALKRNAFDAYTKSGVKLYYIMDRESNKKWAVEVDFDGEMEFWNEKGKRVFDLLEELDLDVSLFVPYSIENVIKLRLKDEGMTKNEDGSYDVSGNVDLKRLGLKEIPFRFRKVDGNFICRENRLVSLKGAPEYVGRYFSCSNNSLVSLKGAPKYVGGDFYCVENGLTSLEGAPEYVGKEFNCTVNKLRTLIGSPKFVGKRFDCMHNKLISLKGAPKHVGEDFVCGNNRLTTLKDISEDIGGNVFCGGNPVSREKLLKTIGR